LGHIAIGKEARDSSGDWAHHRTAELAESNYGWARCLGRRIFGFLPKRHFEEFQIESTGWLAVEVQKAIANLN
jgi:hypothetical protein